MKTLEKLELQCLTSLEHAKAELQRAETLRDHSSYGFHRGAITALQCVLETICEDVDINDINK